MGAVCRLLMKSIRCKMKVCLIGNKIMIDAVKTTIESIFNRCQVQDDGEDERK